MEKLTRKIRIPVNANQYANLEAAAVKCGLRVVDVCRFGILEFLENPTASRYTYTKAGLPRGTRVAMIQVPITPTMEDRLVDVAQTGFSNITAVDLARIAVCDFARRHK